MMKIAHFANKKVPAITGPMALIYMAKNVINIYLKKLVIC